MSENNSILVVTDQLPHMSLIGEFTKRGRYSYSLVEDAHAALEELHRRDYAVVVCEARPRRRGNGAVLDLLKEKPRETEVILVSGHGSLEPALEMVREGATDLLVKPFCLDDLRRSLNRAISKRNRRRRAAAHRQEVGRTFRTRTRSPHGMLGELRRGYDQMLEVIVGALGARDVGYSHHPATVRAYADRLFDEVGDAECGRQDLRWAALLHDIGTITVSDSVFKKRGKLDEVEWASIRMHPEIGHLMLRPVSFLSGASEIVRAHHERWDGQGYTRGLHRGAIPQGARILALAESYEAMTSPRPYRPALPISEVRKELRLQAGAQFDPALVERFLQVPAEEWVEIKQQAIEKTQFVPPDLALPPAA